MQTNKVHSRLWLAAAIIVSVCLTWYTLGYMVTVPGHMYLDLGGDAIKNYFTYLHHSLYGDGFEFTGMNYPYGENVIYADGQPLLSIPLQYLHGVFHFPLETALAVMHLSIAAGFVLCIIYLYRILIHYKVHPALSIVFAAFITLLSPQFNRIFAHFGLSYMCVIPMLFYWSVQYYERARSYHAILIGISGIAASFLHPYFAAVYLLWIGFYSIGYLLFFKSSARIKLKHLLPLVISLIAIFSCIKGVMFFTDHLKDRPTYPWGTFTALTTSRDIYTSIYSPIWMYLKNHSLIYYVSNYNEGFTYIGLAAAGILLASVIFFVTRFFYKKNDTILLTPVPFPRTMLFIAFASLCLGMGIPFIWNMEWLLDYISILRQFRTLGRFSLIFYYIATIYSVIAAYTWYQRLVHSNKKMLGYLAVILPLLLWGFEARSYLKFSKERTQTALYNYRYMDGWDDDKTWKEVLADKQYNPTDFQAMLLLPFMHVGSEKLWVNDANSWLLTLGAKASFKLNLPIVDVNMSRSSWSQTFGQVRIAAGPFADKPLLRDIKSNKPFLILWFGQKPLDPDSKYLLEASEFIADYSQCHVYACFPNRLKTNDKRFRDSVNFIAAKMTKADTCINAEGSYAIAHFDHTKSNAAFFGNGGLQAIKGETAILYTTLVPQHKDSAVYEFSAWVKVNDYDYCSPTLYVDLYNANARLIDSVRIYTKESVDNYVNTGAIWLRTNAYFHLPADCRSIQVRVLNSTKHAYLAIDEMLLRPSGALIISKGADGKILANNHLLRK